MIPYVTLNKLKGETNTKELKQILALSKDGDNGNLLLVLVGVELIVLLISLYEAVLNLCWKQC